MKPITVAGARQRIHLFVGSKNPVKASATTAAARATFPGAEIVVDAIDADVGISDWASPLAVGQPFGLEQTRRGAQHRMNDCVNKARGTSSTGAVRIAVGLENGLVRGEEIGRLPGRWYDTCVAAVCLFSAPEAAIVCNGVSVLTPFGRSGRTFDEQVANYHKEIMPRVHRKEDLYLAWTKDFDGGPYSRAYFLEKCLINCFKQLCEAGLGDAITKDQG